MHITLAAIGKLKDPALKSLFDTYNRRLTWKLNVHEFEAKRSKQQEGALLHSVLPPGAFLIILDERGEELTSEAFADCLKNIQVHHQGKVAFAIGGADGLSEDIKQLSQKSIAFGRMTWPHLLARVMLVEQLYRAEQILKGHPYHRGG